MQTKKSHEKKTQRPAGLKTVPRTPISEITPEQQIVGATFLGKIQNYYSHLKVMALTLEAPLAIGDTIRIKGHTTDLTEKVEALQVEHLSVQSAAPGESVAIPAADKVRAGDAVYKV
jgi:hypothetical protein